MVTLVWLWLLFPCVTPYPGQPPYVPGGAGWGAVVVEEGGLVTLTCPVLSPGPGRIFYRWYRDHVELDWEQVITPAQCDEMG